MRIVGEGSYLCVGVRDGEEVVNVVVGVGGGFARRFGLGWQSVRRVLGIGRDAVEGIGDREDVA